ncbi:MAG TPA: hypothetical protein VKA46_09105 [Gemmataceae bacterium]|nr:hypothetical protein [Gemmataceae bacterium]
MTIKFVCSCGKRLRARDEMARRRSFCPRCGQPVGIPSGEPTHPGTAAAPLTPAERLRLGRRREGTPAADSATVTLPHPRRPSPSPTAEVARDRVGTLVLALLTGRRAPGKQRHRPPETRWYQCLLYPFHDWRLWVGPALLLTALSIAGVLLAPRLLLEEPGDAVPRWTLRLSAVLGLFLGVGFTYNFLGCVLRSAARGDTSPVRWAGHTLLAASGAAVVWLACILAGPVVPAALAVAYWLQCGDPAAVDWLILGELGILTVGYGLLVLAAVGERGRLRDANPLQVIDLAHRLGFRAALVTVAGSALALAQGVLLVVAALELHRAWPVGVLLLAASWFGGLFGATFLFRLLGVWCYRTRPAEQPSPTQENT